MLPVILIPEGMDGGGMLLQRVVPSGIKRQYLLMKEWNTLSNCSLIICIGAKF